MNMGFNDEPFETKKIKTYDIYNGKQFKRT